MTQDHEPRPPEENTPEPQRRSTALAGAIVIGLVLVMIIGIGVLWAAPWADDTEQDPSLPGFQEDPTPGPVDDDDGPAPGGRFWVPTGPAIGFAA